MRLLLGLVVMLVPGGSAAAVDPPTERHRGDLTIRARAILKKYCAACHRPAGKSFDILNHAIITGKHHVPFVSAGLGGRSQIIEFIEDGSMPPAGKKRPSQAELKTLKDWISHGAPQYPKEFDPAYALETVRADWLKQKAPENYRYISFAHTVQDSTAGLGTEVARLRDALAAATTKPVELIAVDPSATIFRLDIAKAGWTAPDLFEPSLKSGDVHPIKPFDLVLLENPYPFADEKLDSLVPKPRAVAPVPYLRGDWLGNALQSPLAADLRSLVELADAIAGGKPPTCGPVPKMFPLKNAPGGSAPITAWYATKADDPFKVEFTINGGTNPVVEPKLALDLQVKSEIAADFRLIHVMHDGFTRSLPVSGGESLKKNEPRSLTAAKGAFTASASATEHFILIVSPRDNPLPLPTILKSTHDLTCTGGRSPVWRMLFDTSPTFDPTKAVRKIVTVQVQKK